jgi:hypothetical protein
MCRTQGATLVAAVMAGLLLWPVKVQAEQVTWEFTGEITTVNGKVPAPFGSATVGDAYTLTFTFSSTVTDSCGSPVIGCYEAIGKYTLTIGGVSVAAELKAPDGPGGIYIGTSSFELYSSIVDSNEGLDIELELAAFPNPFSTDALPTILDPGPFVNQVGSYFELGDAVDGVSGDVQTIARLVGGDATFGMEVTGYWANDDGFDIQTTGALFEIDLTGISLYSRIDAGENDWCAPVLVGTITFDDAQTALTIVSATADEVVVTSDDATFIVGGDSVLQITATNLPFEYEYESEITSLWTKNSTSTSAFPLGGAELPYPKIWTDGSRGSFRAIGEPGCTITDDTATTCSISIDDDDDDNGMMVHMVFPARFFDFERMYGSASSPSCAEIARESDIENVFDVGSEIGDYCGIVKFYSYFLNGNTMFPPARWISDRAGHYRFNRVTALAEDGAGTLYVAGDIQKRVSSATALNYVAEVDGSGYLQPLRDGLSGGEVRVRAMCLYGGEIIVGGCFDAADGSTVNNIARWNPTTRVWSSLGTGLTGGGTMPGVYAMFVYDSNLYVGGRFSSAGGVSVNNLAMWNGSVWSDVGGGVSGDEGYVLALESWDGDLVVGGSFTEVGTTPLEVDNIALYDTSTGWAEIADSPRDGATNLTLALLNHGGTLYVAGGYVDDSGPVAKVHTYDGSDWTAVGEFAQAENASLMPWIFDMESYDGDVCVTGDFAREIETGNLTRIARYDEATDTWACVGSGIERAGYVMLSRMEGETPMLYVGGEFGSPFVRLARVTGATWSDPLADPIDVETGRPEWAQGLVDIEVGPYAGYRGSEYRNPDKMKALIDDLQSEGFDVIQYLFLPQRTWEGQSYQDTLAWLVWFATEHGLDGYFFDLAFPVPTDEEDDRWWTAYLLLKGLRKEMGDDFIIYHHSSVDIVGGNNSGVTCVPAETYATFSYRGETGDLARVQGPTDDYLRYYVIQQGMAQSIGVWLMKSDRTPPMSRKEWVQLMYGANCAVLGGTRNDEWDHYATYADPVLYLKQLDYASGPSFDSSLDWTPSWFHEITPSSTSSTVSSITISWNTPVDTDTEVIYAVEGEPMWDGTAMDASPKNRCYNATETKNHTVNISDLAANTTYTLRLRSKTGTGVNEDVWGTTVDVTTAAD